MEEIHFPQRSGISVTEQDIATLNNYAEKKRQERTELSEVMSTVPAIVHRGGLYLISAAVGFTAIVFSFGRIPVWIDARGVLVPEVGNIPVLAEETGVVTEVFADVGQQLPQDAALFKLNPEPATLTPVIAPEQLQALQAVQEKELEIVQEKLQLVQLELYLNAQHDLSEQHYQQIPSHYQQEVVELTAQLDDLQTQIAMIQAQIDPHATGGSIITAPQAGMIVDLAVTAPGQLVSRGSVVAVIIPGENQLTVEANISERDISSIRVGMDAQIKVDAYNFQQYGDIPAQVTRVLPDLERPGNFIVALDLLENKQPRDRPEMTLLPGLNVQVEIQVEERRLFELLLGQP